MGIEVRSSTAREFGGSILYDDVGRYIRLSRRLCISWNKVHRNKNLFDALNGETGGKGT